WLPPYAFRACRSVGQQVLSGSRRGRGDEVIAARQAQIAEGGAAVPRRSWPKERQLAALALFAIPAVRDRASSHSDCPRAKRRLGRRDISGSRTPTPTLFGVSRERWKRV